MQKDRLTVMQIVSNLEIGGAQEVVRTLSENLEGAGCDMVVCTFKDGSLRTEIEGLGIPVEVLPSRRYSIVAFPLYFLEVLKMRKALVDLVNKHQIEVVQSHLLRSLDFLVLTLKLRRNLLVFWTFQNANFILREDHLQGQKWLLRPKRAAYRLLYRLCAHWVDGFIAVSDDVKTAILSDIGFIPEDKVTVICNSVDVKRYQGNVDKAQIHRQLGLPENASVMAVVATFKEQKGHRFMIEATSSVVEQFPKLHILFIGDGDLREELQAQTKALDLDKHIHFLGNRNDVPELLAASDYFVLPSLWEGLSMALVEAMASGLPIIATEVSGTHQVIIPNETGLLVPPGDSQLLGKAMIQILTNSAQAEAMGTAAKKRVGRYFSAQKQAQDHIALYSEKLKSNSSNVVMPI